MVFSALFADFVYLTNTPRRTTYVSIMGTLLHGGRSVSRCFCSEEFMTLSRFVSRSGIMRFPQSKLEIQTTMFLPISHVLALRVNPREPRSHDTCVCYKKSLIRIAALINPTSYIMHSQSDRPRTNPLNPLYVAPHCREVLVTVFRDEYHVFDPDASDALVAF